MATALAVPETKIGRLREALLHLHREHAAEGMLPTSGRFLWYELVQRGIVDKTKARGHPGVKRGVDQDVTEALTQLREAGAIPWEDIADETRSLSDFTGYRSMAAGALAHLNAVRLDPWGDDGAPLILCESRSLAGVLDGLAAQYRCLIAPTNGQAGGFLRTKVGPLVEDGSAGRVLYLGDWDHRGGLIEGNTRRVLEEYAPWLDWERVALTDAQVQEHQLPVIHKTDRAYRPPRTYPAVETEALGQRLIVGLLRARLDALLPRSLADVQERERAEREALRRRLEAVE